MFKRGGIGHERGNKVTSHEVTASILNLHFDEDESSLYQCVLVNDDGSMTVYDGAFSIAEYRAEDGILRIACSRCWNLRWTKDIKFKLENR